MDFDVINGKTRKRKTLTEVEKGVLYRTGSRTNILGISPAQTELASKSKKVATTIPTESGGERLKRAHTLLIKAQVETKDILTPILLRMERAKKIKTADQALQSIGVLLSYPHNMRIALGKGEYEDVLLISRKILLMSPGNVLSSAKVLIQVQKTALSIVEELRNKSLHVLLGDEKEKEREKNDNSFESENNNHNNNNANNNNNQDQGHVRNVPTIPELYRHVNLLFEIEGEEKQKQHLKNCFYRKLIKFGEEIQEYRVKYFYDSNMAVKQGKKYFNEKMNESNHRRKDSKNSVSFSNNNGSKENFDSYDNHGIDLKSVKPASFSTMDNKTKKAKYGFGLNTDWFPADITKNEKSMLKNLLNGRNNKNEKRGREMNNNDVYDLKQENGKLDSKLLSDFGLSEDDGDDDNDDDDNEDDDNDEEERNREEEERKNVKFATEKTTKIDVEEDENSHPKIQKFKFFESAEDEETARKESNRIKMKEKERIKEQNKDKRNGGIYIIGQASENHFSELFCARVRLLYILRVVRAVDAWTPVLTQ